MYAKLEEGTDQIKGKLRERLIENKELAFLSRELGRINIDSPIEENLEEMKVEEWDKEQVYCLFKKYRFNRFIERFHLEGNEEKEEFDFNLFQNIKIEDEKMLEEIKKKLIKQQKFIYYFKVRENRVEGCIIPKEIESIYFPILEDHIIYEYMPKEKQQLISFLRDLFEKEEFSIIGYELSKDYILLKQIGITPRKFDFDIKIAAYLLNPTMSKYTLEGLALRYLQIDILSYLEKLGIKEEKQQLNLFDTINQHEDESKQVEKQMLYIYTYVIAKLEEVLRKDLEKENTLELFQTIEMPLVKVLADMQYVGMYVDKQELISYGDVLKENIQNLTMQIYELAGEEFNINSPKQLGDILFEKLKLPYSKKNKNGYSTDVDALEKLQGKHAIIDLILEYRGLMKLNSTYVEGLLPYINSVDHRIHSFFHQTVTATGRISSTEPNLQNIPTRVEAGKKIRKAFKPTKGHIFLDADYSQIELRVLAHISKDKHMIDAFNNDEDIHKQAASKVLNIPIEEVTKDQRSKAKAVNFGIVYGISDFGLAGQIGVSRKEAKEYIEQYLEKYSGIKQFMNDIVEEAKENGYVETLFHRRRYLPELKSNSYVVRQFGERAAMNTPIQGTAADIMKIAMIHTFEELEKRGLKSKIVLQVHDELIIDTKIDEKEEVQEILKSSMENATKLIIPLNVELSEAINWYEAK